MLRRGFTLVELMVVIAIIALMTGIIMVNLTTSKTKAKDGQRVSDIGQIQLALGLYFDRCNQFPSTIAGDLTTIKNGCPSLISLSNYIGKIPTPPLGSSTYDYVLNSTYTDYVLHTTLDAPVPAATANGLSSVPSSDTTVGTGSTFTCSSASNSLDYCVGPK